MLGSDIKRLRSQYDLKADEMAFLLGASEAKIKAWEDKEDGQVDASPSTSEVLDKMRSCWDATEEKNRASLLSNVRKAIKYDSGVFSLHAFLLAIGVKNPRPMLMGHRTWSAKT